MPLLAINKTYKDGDILFAADLDNICNSVESFLNGTNLDETNIQTSILDSLALTGMIMLYGSGTIPSGWLECNGQVVSQATYAALYNILQSTYNTGGEGAGNFRLPDFTRRTPMGQGGTRVSSSAPDINMGNTGGEETHALTIPEMPAHTHTDSGHTHVQNSTNGFGTSPIAGPPWYFMYHGADGSHVGTGAIQTASATVPTTASTGSGTAHNNVQPSLVSCFIIKT